MSTSDEDLLKRLAEIESGFRYASDWRQASNRIDATNKADAIRLAIQKLQPRAWVKASERMPTLADADYSGNVWMFVNYGKGGVVGLYHWKAAAHPDSWMPTGLTRPQPPQPDKGQPQ
jgi:hypothetical protein